MQCRTVRRRRTIACAALGCALVAAAFVGCQAARQRGGIVTASPYYPPRPQPPRVIALGTLRGADAPTKTEVELAMFLFGAEPPAPLAIANPTGLAAEDGTLLICDNALHVILRWDEATGKITEGCRSPALEHPFAIDIAPNGYRLICDHQGAWRCDGRGMPQRIFRLDDVPFKPGGVCAVDEEVWVSNLALHRIEVFDLATGAHRGHIGSEGSGPAEFALPRSMARLPDGNVGVIDMLNNRVQILDPTGEWVADIGRAGNAVGAFGRPKDIAVGPDGTVFVTDAFSQRVHAFAPDGRPLLAFGEPGSGIGELTMPNGIAISQYAPRTEARVSPDERPAYYVLVSEQINRPGVRVYAWLGDYEADVPRLAALPSGRALDWQPSFPESTAINPHWHPERCDTCHTMLNGRAQPVPLAQTDALCVSCHDGVQAPADPHPIGRPADTEVVTTPDDWPTVDGQIACLTCHDIIRHCDRDAARPAINSVLLRGYDPQRPLDYCTTCHDPDIGGRFSPHRQRDATGRVREDACLFCHTERPEVPPTGERQFEPELRDETSDLCLNCHVPHWDLSPKGHVDRPVTPEIRQWMLMRELSLEHPDDSVQELARMAARLDREPARLPLGDGMVTCYTCHNPHYTGLFPPDSELGALAENPADRKAALRTDWIDLCSECHHH